MGFECPTLIRERFGPLTVRSELASAHGRDRLWLCSCRCGAEYILSTRALVQVSGSRCSRCVADYESRRDEAHPEAERRREAIERWVNRRKRLIAEKKGPPVRTLLPVDDELDSISSSIRTANADAPGRKRRRTPRDTDPRTQLFAELDGYLIPDGYGG